MPEALRIAKGFLPVIELPGMKLLVALAFCVDFPDTVEVLLSEDICEWEASRICSASW